TTSGGHFGAGRDADTPTNRADGFGRNTSGPRVSGIGGLRLKPEGMTADRERCGCYPPPALGLSDTSESNRTPTHSTRPGTLTSRSVKARGCWSGCRDVASQIDSGSSNKANVRDAINSSSKMIDGCYNLSSPSRLVALVLPPI